MMTFARFSVLSLALVGFAATNVASHPQTSSSTVKAGKLVPSVQSMTACGYNNERGCNLQY